MSARRRPDADHNGNVARSDGLDRCACGCKYWENDRCIDCGGTEVDDDDATYLLGDGHWPVLAVLSIIDEPVCPDHFVGAEKLRCLTCGGES